MRTLALLITLIAALIAAPALAARVTAPGDSGAPGELRSVVEGLTRPGAEVTFAPGVNPELSGRAITISAPDMLIKGNTSAGGPGTRILRGAASAEPVLHFTGGRGNGLRLQNLDFSDIRHSGGNTPLYGGGVISAQNDGSAGARIRQVGNTAFSGIAVTLHNNLNGAGLLGAANTKGPAGIDSIGNGTFTGNTLRLTNTADAESGRIWGAGLVGAFAQGGAASLGNVHAFFRENTVVTGTYINGAGLVGSFVPMTGHDALMGKLSGQFINNRVIVGTNISGGGLAGTWTWAGNVRVGDISADFTNNIVSAKTSYMRGGGLVGLRTYLGTAHLGVVSGSFTGNSVIVGDSLGGGGIIGLYTANTAGSRSYDKSSTFAGLSGASFIGNRVTVGTAGSANAYALGGVIAVTGLDRPLVIRNTHMRNNSLTLTGAGIHDVGGGALYIGTDRKSANPRGHVVILTADAGNSTEFKNNSITLITKGKTSRRTNSITFGREWDSAGDTLLHSLADAVLHISPAARGRVALFDPLRANMDNGKSLTVNLSGAAGSHTLWAGRNRLFADGGATVNFTSGSTELAPDFQLSGRAGKPLAVTFAPAHTLRLNLTGRSTTLPHFSRPTQFTAKGAGTLRAAYYGLDATAGREWLITDARGAVGARSFTLADNPLFDTQLRAKGQSLLMRLDNSRAIAPIAAGASRNTRRAHAQSALPKAWGTAIFGLESAHQAAALAWARNNAPALTAEGLLTQGTVALRAARSIRAQSLLQAGQLLAEVAALPGAQKKEASAPRPVRPWLGYIGSEAGQSGHNGHSGYNTHFKGLAGGVNAAPKPWLELGLYAACADAHTSYKRLSTSVDTTILQAGTFLRFTTLEKGHILLDAYYAHLQNDSGRATFFAREKADFDQKIFGGAATFDYNIPLGKSLRLTPRAGLEYQHLRQDSTREKGSPLSQRLDGTNAHSWRGGIGFDLGHTFILPERLELTPALQAGYNHEFGDRRLGATAQYAGSPRTVNMTSIQQDRDYGEAGIHLRGRILSGRAAGLGFSGGYSVEFGRTYTQQNFQAGLHWEF